MTDFRNIRKTSGRTLHDIVPTIKRRKLSHLQRSTETKFNWLRSGFSRLNDHLYRHGQLAESPQCECNQDVEDTKHFLLDCTRYEEERDVMIEAIERTYIRQNIPQYDRTIEATRRSV